MDKQVKDTVAFTQPKEHGDSERCSKGSKHLGFKQINLVQEVSLPTEASVKL